MYDDLTDRQLMERIMKRLDVLIEHEVGYQPPPETREQRQRRVGRRESGRKGMPNIKRGPR